MVLADIDKQILKVFEKTISKYPNNVTGGIKDCICRKSTVFRAGDMAAMKATEKYLDQQLRESRRQQKVRAEQEFANSSINRLRDSLRKMTNIEPTRKPVAAQNESVKAN